VLVIASGANRVDEVKVADLVGEEISKADAAFVRARTGFAIGGVPPVGHAESPETLLDEDLLQWEEIWAAAGTPNSIFKLTPAELVTMTQGRIARIA
jgi:prolyl-tRNA editing enzyme YbaK/EbsC (Cys-tRNA(Pro) deacylase)